MATKRLRRMAALLALLAVSAAGGVGRAETSAAQAAPQSYRDAQYVQINLAAANQESGIRLLADQPNGQTQPAKDGNGRQTAANQPGADRFFYFDVHDTYIDGGRNKVVMTVQYLDLGLTPFYLEYDSFDPLRPDAQAEDVLRKRIAIVSRSHSEALKSAYITLEDARFGNHQPGGADFRIGGPDDLILTNVSVLRVSHEEAQPAIQIALDGKRVTFDSNEVQPFIHPVTSSTLVPFRAMFNALGVSNDSITWNNETRTVEARKGQTTIRLTIDSDVAVVNGLPKPLPQPAAIVGNRMVVPLRFISEQFGLKVEWREQERLIVLVSPAPQPQPQPQQP